MKRRMAFRRRKKPFSGRKEGKKKGPVLPKTGEEEKKSSRRFAPQREKYAITSEKVTARKKEGRIQAQTKSGD